MACSGARYEMVDTMANSRAASSGIQKEDVMVTEVVNGLIVSKLAKKIEYIGEGIYAKSKAASVPGINKLKVIHDFIRSNGRI